jgi:hypothetical protein
LNNIRLFIFLAILILFLSGNFCSASDSNCEKYDWKRKASIIEISPDTLERMLKKCKKKAHKTIEIIIKELEAKQIESKDVQGIFFYYDDIGAKVHDCNIYYRFKTDLPKKMRSFHRDEKYDCSNLVNKVVYTFLNTRKEDIEKITKPYLNQKIGKYKVVHMIDPTLSEINLIITRHPQMKKMFENEGVRFLDIPVPLSPYPIYGNVWEEAGMAGLEKKLDKAGLGLKYNILLTVAGALDPRRKLPESSKQGSPKRYIHFPATILITEEIEDKDELYEIKEGDIIEDIAKHFFGDKDFWGIIYQINRDNIKDPKNLIPGNKIRIPKKENLLLPIYYEFVPFGHAYTKE